MPEPEPLKGDEVHFVGGKYLGKKGWMNAAKTQPAKMKYVIVDLGDGNELATRVRKDSVGQPPLPPNSYEEAALQQIPEVELALRKAARLLAKCGVQEWTEACRIFEAFGQEESQKLMALGSKATYHTIEWGDENQGLNDLN